MVYEGRIIDAHCHVASVEFTPPSFIEGVIDNQLRRLAALGIHISRNRLRDQYLQKMQDSDCAELVSEMDEAGIEKSVLLLPDLTYALRDSKLSIAEMFDRHRTILQARPDRFFVFAGVDPRWGADGLQLFERAVTEYGFHGLKLYPPCGYSPSDRSLYPFYEICMKHHLPVISHIGASSPALAFDSSLPIHIDRAARDFPTVNFILGHGGVQYVEEGVMMCAYRPNVYIDISGFESRPLTHLTSLFLHNISHKIVFGTDWPVFRLQGTQNYIIGSLLDNEGPLRGLRRPELFGFLSGTIESLLNIS